MEWYDPRTVIDARFLEPNFRLAQGTLYDPNQFPIVIAQN